MVVEETYSDTRDNEAIDSIQVAPICKTNWKTGGARDYWSDKLNGALEAMPQVITSILGDESHPRDAFILRTGKESLDKIAFHMKDIDGGYIETNIVLEVDGLNRSLFTDYVNTVTFGPRNQTSNMSILAKDKETAERLTELLVKGYKFDDTDFDPNKTRLWRPEEMSSEEYHEVCDILGIPTCCADHHEESFFKQKVDPVYSTACNSISGEQFESTNESVIVNNPDPYLNQFWRYMGYRLTFHVPCSFDCERSGELARQNYQHLSNAVNLRDDYDELLLAWLQQPMMWSGYHGLVHQKTAYRIGSYRTDDYWSEKRIVWRRPHKNKPEFEPIHPTSELESIDPSHGAL